MYVYVFDYGSGQIKEFETGLVQAEDIEAWLSDEKGFKQSQICWMSSFSQLDIERED